MCARANFAERRHDHDVARGIAQPAAVGHRLLALLGVCHPQFICSRAIGVIGPVSEGFVPVRIRPRLKDVVADRGAVRGVVFGGFPRLSPESSIRAAPGAFSGSCNRCGNRRPER